MKRYEYKELVVPENTQQDMLNLINEYGAAGWRCVTWVAYDNGGYSALLERASHPTQTSFNPNGCVGVKKE